MSRQLRLIHVAVGILRQQQKVLVAERPSGKPSSGYWEFPGGKIETNESAHEALIRELHEELGIAVQAAQHLFTYQYTYPDRIVLMEIFLVESYTGEPHGNENQILRWVTFAELSTLRLLAGNIPILERIEAQIRSL